MKGLIIKDFLFMKYQVKIIVILYLFYSAMLFVSGNSTIFSVVNCIITPIVAVNCSAYDDSANWNRFACALPFSRSQIVRSRYFTLLGLLAGLTVLSTLIIGIMGLFSKKPDAQIDFLLIGITALFSIVSIAVMVPLLIKFGAQNARLVMMALIILPMIAMPIILETFGAGFMEFIEKTPVAVLFILALVLSLAVLWISYSISLKVFGKKDF